MPPLVSIIIPNFNRGAMLSETVASCYKQQKINIEVIVVDDGSTDGSADEVKSLYPQITLIRQSNQGAPAARNRGLDVASGRYIKFIDSDDKLNGSLLPKQVDFLRQSGADVVYGDFEFFGNLEDSRVGGKPLRVTGSVDCPVDALLGDWWCAPFSYLFRADALSTIRWNTTLTCLQDFDFILRVALSGKRFVYQPGITGYYRMHEGQITNSFSKNYAINRCIILDETISFLTNQGQLASSRKQLIADGYWTAARAFYGTDGNRFEETVSKIYALVPRFTPSLWAPRPVKLLTALLGIKKAEMVLALRRGAIRRLKPGAFS